MPRLTSSLRLSRLVPFRKSPFNVQRAVSCCDDDDGDDDASPFLATFFGNVFDLAGGGVFEVVVVFPGGGVLDFDKKGIKIIKSKIMSKTNLMALKGTLKLGQVNIAHRFAR